MNADGYVSTGQGLNSANMFAYCGNNPVIRGDRTGQFWSEIWNFTKETANQIGQVFKSVAPVYAGMGAGTMLDGPLPVADLVLGAGAIVLTVGAIGYGTYQSTQSIPKAQTKAKEKDIAPNIPLKKKVVFPQNPNNFRPIGLIMVDRKGKKMVH